MSYEPSTVKEIIDRDHGYLSGTQDGLSEEDRTRGYHYYGAYKVYHACRECGEMRKVVAYDRGWVNSESCTQCDMRESLTETNSRLMARTPPEGISGEWMDALEKNGMKFGRAMYYKADHSAFLILGYDEKNDELWTTSRREGNSLRKFENYSKMNEDLESF